MSNSRRIINNDNINGVNLCLEIENRTCSPVSQRYIITYKSKEQKSAALPMKPIILAVIVNFLAAYCFYIKVQDILMILSALFFMFMFWIVYSVKSVISDDAIEQGSIEDLYVYRFLHNITLQCYVALMHIFMCRVITSENRTQKIIVHEFTKSILVISSVGIQVTTQYVFNIDSKLIPWSDIKDISINEVIKLNRVIYILLILVKNEDSVSLVPLFKHTKPRLPMLETIYSELHELLRITATRGSDLAGGDKL